MKPKAFRSAHQFRAWLAAHHDSETELLVALRKLGNGPGLTYKEAVDEALCFGWIDGVRRRIDDQTFSVRFTPRKARSIWSQVNLRRAQKLIEEGRVAEPGQRAFDNRDPTKERLYSFEQREQARFDEPLAAKLRSNKPAATFFDAQPPGYRRLATFWVMQAKKEETRLRRMQHLIACSERRERIDLAKR